MVAEIDRQDGCQSKQATFYVELVDLSCSSKMDMWPPNACKIHA
jgi:hypothetical protein